MVGWIPKVEGFHRGIYVTSITEGLMNFYSGLWRRFLVHGVLADVEMVRLSPVNGRENVKVVTAETKYLKVLSDRVARLRAAVHRLPRDNVKHAGVVDVVDWRLASRDTFIPTDGPMGHAPASLREILKCPTVKNQRCTNGVLSANKRWEPVFPPPTYQATSIRLGPPFLGSTSGVNSFRA